MVSANVAIYGERAQEMTIYRVRWTRKYGRVGTVYRSMRQTVHNVVEQFDKLLAKPLTFPVVPVP